jgi:hypothetical protein
VVLVYASVWLAWRPMRFELDDTSFRTVWPTRSCNIPRTTITGVRLVGAADFRTKYGFGMGMGASGLWGGFGLLKT